MDHFSCLQIPESIRRYAPCSILKGVQRQYRRIAQRWFPEYIRGAIRQQNGTAGQLGPTYSSTVLPTLIKSSRLPLLHTAQNISYFLPGTIDDNNLLFITSSQLSTIQQASHTLASAESSIGKSQASKPKQGALYHFFIQKLIELLLSHMHIQYTN